ncbi:hypothetical protein SAMN06265375_101669 [Muriicola jejuensis]|uniref:DUF4221 domain-containing protein n=1 Tax=Muriicola jejuensis TaxID=504488 RepID=A0A6P0UB45_9FLAO|nr:hypothetical protein [Muriicola jejuensis]NER09812.1 hypothetical protein [Muriicola jejuensis]SMP05542.1 hypothetical protein SAMN06265375_101669 [Muriicola jejuensis]
MRPSHFLGFCLILLAFNSCSKDSAPGIEQEEVILPDFRLIGEDASSVYQYSYDGSSQTGVEANLTQNLGVDPLYLTLRQVGEVVSFYSFASNRFSLIQLNSLTGQSAAFPDFYTVSDERAITWGANSEDLIFLGYYSPKGSRDFGLRTLDPTDGSFTDLPIALNIQQAYAPLYHRQRLMFTYRDGSGAYKIGIFNTESRTLMVTLDFNSGIPNILIDDLGNIGIMIGLGNSQFVYQVLDIETLDLLSETPFTLEVFLPPGPLQGSVFGSTLFYTNFLAQPSEVPFGPAYFNFETNTNFMIDIIEIIRQVEDETGTEVEPTAIRYYEETETFLVGYAHADLREEVEGGVLVISKTGLLQERIALPFVPTFFIRP